MEEMARLRGRTRNKSIAGTAVVMIITLLMTFVIFTKEPIGDDVLCSFEGALTFYLDEYPYQLGERITSLAQIGSLLRFVYNNWSGRIPGYAMHYIGYLLPKTATAAITAVMYTLVCLLALRILFGNLKTVLEYPLYFVLLYLMLFWTRPSVFHTHMWIMTGIYAGGVMLCLLYWNMVQSEKNSSQYIACMQLVGFLAGMAHEVISLCTIVVIFFLWLIDVWDKKRPVRTIFVHSGLMLGYVLGFFAPGNFNRTGQSHDVRTSDLASSLINSIQTHIHSILGADRWMKMLVLGFIVLVAVSFVYLLLSGKNIRKLCREITPMLLGGSASILVWGLMPTVPFYGMDLWIVLVMLVSVKLIHSAFRDVKLVSTLNRVAAVLLLCFAVNLYQSEVTAMATVSLERTHRIQAAVEQNLTEVVVPEYPDWLPQDRYSISYLNNQNEYDFDSHRKYYQIHVIVETEGNVSS